MSVFVHHPEFGGPGHRTVLDVHPAMPRQQALEDVPHDEDDADPQPRAHQHAPHRPLVVTGQVPAGEGQREAQRRKERKIRGRAKDRIEREQKTHTLSVEEQLHSV